MDNKRPFIRLHEHSCSLGTSGVVGSGAAAMRALHTAARCLLHPLLTIVTLLMEKRRLGQSVLAPQASCLLLQSQSHTGNLQEHNKLFDPLILFHLKSVIFRFS